MSIGVVGKKSGMTRIFTEEGASVPVTVIEVQPNRITQVKTAETDGYAAVQVTTGSVKQNRVSKPLAGHFAKANTAAGRGLWEFRVEAVGEELGVGTELKVDQFEAGQRVDVRGVAAMEGLRYRLEASQSLQVRLQDGRLTEQRLLNEQSLLRSGERALPVTLVIPDQVLTGSRYDVDVIVDEPLGHAVVAGGLLPLTPEQVRDQLRPNLPMAPLGGGGLFKSVQAPQRPGAQTWAVMLVHPDGLVTATKRVRVVSVIPRGTI